MILDVSPQLPHVRLNASVPFLPQDGCDEQRRGSGTGGLSAGCIGLAATMSVHISHERRRAQVDTSPRRTDVLWALRDA